MVSGHCLAGLRSQNKPVNGREAVEPVYSRMPRSTQELTLLGVSGRTEDVDWGKMLVKARSQLIYNPAPMPTD